MEDAITKPRGNAKNSIASAGVRRSQCIRFPSTRLTDHEILHDSEVTDSGKLTHLAFLADMELISWK